MTHDEYVFCHGLAGTGEYDKEYRSKPYWGSHKGYDIVQMVREKGYDAHAASVAPHGSAWDRACELYAQLAGTRTDYGRYHSEKYNHPRFGKDFSDCPLFERWDEDVRLILIGHSFGGVTVRLLSELMANGDEKERSVTPESELSDLFKGGMADRIKAIVTLAAPTNGTTAYDLFQDPSFDPKKSEIKPFHKLLNVLLKAHTAVKKDSRHPDDFADYDMYIDHAMELNRRISTLKDVYYFSVPCKGTMKDERGRSVPDPKSMESIFFSTAINMGRYTGKTVGGIVIDESWQDNDGLVNTVSARAPIGAPQQELDRNRIEKGIWNILPAYSGDHASIVGGVMRKIEPHALYFDLLDIIAGLE